MELQGTKPGVPSKENLFQEIHCSDCGHAYLVEKGQHSGTCSRCGNVEYFSGEGRPLSALAEEITARRILPRLRDPEPTAKPDPLAPFRATPDGKRVEELRIQLQVEWQLWAAVTLHFHDPAYHMAYITQLLAEDHLEQASARYREHRSVMALLEDSRWQAEVADLMLARIEALAISRIPKHEKNYGFDLPEFLKLLPYDSRMFKVLWWVMGIVVVTRLVQFLFG
jgi:hypothetical protein